MNFPAPDPGWLPFLKMIFGFCLVVILASLSGVIAIEHVEAATSYGLDIILGGLLTLSGGFVQWAFSSSKRADMDKENNKE